MAEQEQTIEVLPLPDDLDALEESQEQTAPDAPPTSKYALQSHQDFERAMRRRARNLKIAAEIAHSFNVEIAERQAQIASLENEIVNLQFDREAGAKPWLGRAAWYEPLIEIFFRAKNAANEKLKSWPSPYGTVKLTKQKPEWRYGDEEALSAWLKANAPQFVRTVTATDKNSLKDGVVTRDDGTVAIIGTGEIVPGVTAKARDPKFEIKD